MICACLRSLKVSVVGFAIDEIYERTWIDKFFLKKLSRLVATETAICAMKTIDDALLTQAVRMAFTDSWIAKLSGIPAERIRQRRKELGLVHTYKMVDTCAGEYDAVTPYFYSTFDMKNEAIRTERKKILVLGSGPIRIGQGIEFDYCSVHSVWALRELGYEAIIANNNPETVSYRLRIPPTGSILNPSTPDDVRAIIENEKTRWCDLPVWRPDGDQADQGRFGDGSAHLWHLGRWRRCS